MTCVHIFNKLKIPMHPRAPRTVIRNADVCVCAINDKYLFQHIAVGKNELTCVCVYGSLNVTVLLSINV